MTLWQPLLGGALIGAAAALMLLLNGRIAGVSGIVGGLLTRHPTDAAPRLSFVAGLLAGGLCLPALLADPFAGLHATPVAALALGGLLVGFGASLGSGCTSGHGVCGVARLSPRSLVATATFMAAGGVTVFVLRHVGGFSW